jgi:hypothetical protein
MSSIGCQNIKATQDTGCDGIKFLQSHVGSQMERNVKEAEVSCEIIIPDDEEALAHESITCFKCMGTSVNKKNLPCRKCKGTGNISSKEIGEVVKMVREEVRDYCGIQFREMFRDYLIKRKSDQRNEVFDKVSCDGCEMCPIRGIRFMCSVCSNYDLCENCEKAGVHMHHPMLKIRKANQAPAKLICQYKNIDNEINPSSLKVSQKSLSKDKKNNIHFSGRFIKENFPDMFEVAPGACFTKIWTIRNDGTTAWPEDVLLIQTNGDNMGANPVPITTVVPRLGEYDWIVEFKAPEQEGKYTSYFRMTFGDNVRFGHKVWCSVLVKKPAMVMMSEPVVVNQSQFEVVNDDDLYEQPLQDKSGELPQVQAIEEAKVHHYPMVNLSISNIFQSPKDIYMQAMEKESDANLKNGL